ncbi:MAG: hypothetical protein JNN02_03880 [Tabrizicola sp.]|nr:hypothetical protein [Tabrizicola sp.]
MKVIQDTETILILEDRPWLIGVLVIVMALMFLYGGMTVIASGELFTGLMLTLLGTGVPLLIGALMVRRVRLTFERDAGKVTRTSRSVFGLTQASYPLDRVAEARVGVKSDSDGTTYRTELRLRDPDQTVPFTTYYTSGSRPGQMAEAVNDWLGLRGGPVGPGTTGGYR